MTPLRRPINDTGQCARGKSLLQGIVAEGTVGKSPVLASRHITRRIWLLPAVCRELSRERPIHRAIAGLQEGFVRSRRPQAAAGHSPFRRPFSLQTGRGRKFQAPARRVSGATSGAVITILSKAAAGPLDFRRSCCQFCCVLILTRIKRTVDMTEAEQGDLALDRGLPLRRQRACRSAGQRRGAGAGRGRRR